MQDAPALAALLSAVSVVGLLEQMGGNGLVFDDGDVEFVLSPDGVQITRGAAVGASLGISFEGAYSSGTGRLDMQGVISPIYLLNGIGQIFTRKGEGLFGFNYRLTGAADNPTVSVNPLSILTPGMFREIFRRPAPVVNRAAADEAVGFRFRPARGADRHAARRPAHARRGCCWPRATRSAICMCAIWSTCSAPATGWS